MAESGPVRVAVVQHDEVLAALEEGRVDDARRLAAKAVDTAAAAFGPDSPDLANVMLTWATAEEAGGDFTTALTIAERAARIAASLTKTDDPELMSLWVNIEVVCASLLATLGALDLAEARLAAALVVAKKVLGPDDDGVLSIHNMRGVTAKFAGRFDDAEAHYGQISAVVDVEPVANKDRLVALLHNLGGLAHSRGRVAEGLLHAQRGLELNIDLFGPDHPDVARDLNAIGALHHDAGDSDAAEAAYRRALEIFEKAFGARHYEVAMTCANLAVSTAAAGDAAAARQLYERALPILQSTLGAAHPDVALVEHNFAVLLAGQGDHEAARYLLAQAETTLALGLPEDHPRLLDVRATIAELSPHTGCAERS